MNRLKKHLKVINEQKREELEGKIFLSILVVVLGLSLGFALIHHHVV